MKFKTEYFTARFCIVFLILIFAITATRFVTRIIIRTYGELACGKIIFFDEPELQVSNKKTASSVSNIKNDFVPWNVRYPFLQDENKPFIEISKKVSTIKNAESSKKIKLELKPISNATEKFQNWIKSNFILRNRFINFCSVLNSVFRWKVKASFLQEDGVVEFTNGHFTRFTQKDDVVEKEKSLNSFNNFLKTKNIPLLYVQAPSKVDPNDKKNFGIDFDFTNQNTDEFLHEVFLQKIDFIDMRKEIQNTGKDFYSFFYKTDHHWTAETGFWAAKIISEKLNEKFDLKIDTSIYDTENFSYTVYEKSSLGAYGRVKRLSAKYMEDITLIAPKKNYSLTVNICSSNETIRDATGGFENMIFLNHLQNKANIYTKAAYSIYLDGNTVRQITNHSSENKVRILFLGESFGNVVVPFLCLGVEQLDSIDLRVFNGSLETWINSHEHYDACVFLINAGVVSGNIDWNSHADLWDFR